MHLEDVNSQLRPFISHLHLYKPNCITCKALQTTMSVFLFFLSLLPLYVISQEQTILLNLKQEWHNPPALQSWNTSTSLPHCNWTGVACTDGLVTAITLVDLNIRDPIPPSICHLQNLTVLDLSLNYIPGGFPTLLYNCSNLQILDLSQNCFIGSIPSDINTISTLTYLNLGANNFSGDVPPSIGSFPNLQTLGLFNNPLNGTFPAVDIGNLSNLEQLLISNTQFIPWTIPKEFGKLTKLWYVWMTNTNLMGEIPVEIGALLQLQRLDLSNNNLTGAIPDSLFSLPNLTILYLPNNKLSGEIPRKIETPFLVEIDLSINQLTGTIPEGFGTLQYLMHFDMYANRLSGQVPAGISRLPYLVTTRLFKNNLSGVLPPDWGTFSKLEEFQVSENQFTGNLPPGLCHGGVLTALIAFSNRLTGGLPSSLENCNSLKHIQVFNNNFSEEVPVGFWSLTNLSTVIIHDNLFSGRLPDKLSWNLSRLEMHNNRFTGPIPSNIMASSNLVVFEASNNLFSGEIPVGLTALSRLLSLSLDGNRISGPLPANILSWTSLITLNLSRNQISGEIPPSISLLPDLNVLDLSNNQLSGDVPPQLAQLGLRLNFLDLSSNQLSGTLPTYFEDSVYDNSFLNNTRLCTRRSGCARVSESSGSKKLEPWLLTMILVLSGVLLIVLVFFAFLAIKDYRRKNRGGDLASYKLTSFQRLDFTESNILSKLTENNLIGSGGSGQVYRVDISRSDQYVAVKKIWSKGNLDQNLEKEFQAEIRILGTIRHSNIVKLLCYISNEKSKFLVYEYMENRSLDQWLHVNKRGSSISSSAHHSILDWPRRMHIAVGAAQGLCYMHHNCSPAIIHRDVKSSNILLDSDFNAKIADFGLAKMLTNIGESDTMSVVAGSFGYMAPEYAHTNKVNVKIDVYSFGVVLLELATGREAKEGGEHTCLAEWAWRHFQEGNTIETILDDEVKEPSYLEDMSMVFKLGLMCTGTLPSTRPSMKEVLQVLSRNGSVETYRKTKVEIENDGVPLLNSGKNGSLKKPCSANVDDYGSLACNNV